MLILLARNLFVISADMNVIDSCSIFAKSGSQGIPTGTFHHVLVSCICHILAFFGIVGHLLRHCFFHFFCSPCVVVIFFGHLCLFTPWQWDSDNVPICMSDGGSPNYILKFFSSWCSWVEPTVALSNSVRAYLRNSYGTSK